MKPNFKDLIPKITALEKILLKWKPIKTTEKISIWEACGRVLAEDIYAKYNFPIVRASAMDGIAVKSEDFTNGIPDTSNWKLGIDFIRADTGDDFDDAFDCVIPIEAVTFLEQGIALADDVKVEKNGCVRPCGSNVKKDTLAAKSSTKLTTLDVTGIAMCGYDEILVLKKPTVAFVPTGSELIPIGQEPTRGQKLDTNSLMVKNLLEEYGAAPILHPIVKDDKKLIHEALHQLLPESDIVILNAGTSKGGEDYCVKLLEEEGQLIFSGVAAVPGRPMSVALIEDKLVINMSGPAFAAFYSMDWLLKTLTSIWLDQPVPTRKTVQATLTKPFRTPPIFSLMARFIVEEKGDGTYSATPVDMHGAGDIGMMAANGLYVSELHEKPHEAGEIIEIELTK